MLQANPIPIPVTDRCACVSSSVVQSGGKRVGQPLIIPFHVPLLVRTLLCSELIPAADYQMASIVDEKEYEFVSHA